MRENGIYWQNPTRIKDSFIKLSIDFVIPKDQYCIMMLNFFRNIAFTKLVKSADRLREFNFRRLPSSNEELFHVDVSDDRGNRIIFKMQKDASGMWHFVDNNLPPWILSSETRLHEVIEEELQRSSVA